MNKRLVAVSVALKLSLVLMLVVAQVTDAAQFQGKALGSRLIFYTLGTCIVAIVWGLMHLAGKRVSFPFRADILIALPFVIDTAGNWLDLFDTLNWWDDVMHFTQWLWLMLGAGTLLVSGGITSRWRQVLLIGGVGALAAVVWEVGEYFLFVQDNPTERATAYQDTIGDLVLGSLGGTLGRPIGSNMAKQEVG